MLFVGFLFFAKLRKFTRLLVSLLSVFCCVCPFLPLSVYYATHVFVKPRAEAKIALFIPRRDDVCETNVIENGVQRQSLLRLCRGMVTLLICNKRIPSHWFRIRSCFSLGRLSRAVSSFCLGWLHSVSFGLWLPGRPDSSFFATSCCRRTQRRRAPPWVC